MEMEKSFRLWKEILYEDDEGDQYYWIALKFDGDTRDSRATSYEISASKEDLEKLIRPEVLSQKHIYLFAGGGKWRCRCTRWNCIHG